MRDQALFKKTTVLYTKFDNVSGLARGDLILVKGFKVGTVSDLELEESDSTMVQVNINDGVKVTRGSRLILKSTGLLGEKFLELVRNRDTDELVASGDFLQGEFEQGMLDSFGDKGGEVFDQLSASMDGIESLVQSMNEALNEENRDNIAVSLAEFAVITQELREVISGKKDDIDAITASTKEILAGMEEVTSGKKEELAQTIDNLESLSHKLDSLSDEVDETTRSLNSILSKIDAGEGTLGKMVSDPNLYNNLDSLTVNLNKLIREIQNNPRKYLKHMRLVDIF